MQHIIPLRVYLTIAAALFVLTAVTVAVSFIDLGGYNAIVALVIAGSKASLVALFFMHLKYDKKINMVVFMVGILFVTVFIALTLFDTLRRADLYDISAKPIKENAAMYEKSDSTKSLNREQH